LQHSGPIVSSPYSVSVGDFNGDDQLDLVVASSAENEDGKNSGVSVLLGNGNGTFQPAVDYGAGSFPFSVVVGDFNGDGKLNLAVAEGSTVSILLGNGDGTFQSATSHKAQFDAISIAAGDFNDHGKLDLAVADYNGSSPGSVSVLLQVPVVSLSTTGLKFTDQVLGTSSARQAITLKNTGYLPLKIASLRITGTNAADFSQLNTCDNEVSPGASCTISATFTPTQIGPRTAVVTITDNAVVSPQSVALSGTGVASGQNATLSLTRISFPTQVLGTTSSARSFALLNYGTNSLSISSIAISGTEARDFMQTHTCGTSLAAGASCSISVTFKPTTSGNHSAAVSITDNCDRQSTAGKPDRGRYFCKTLSHQPEIRFCGDLYDQPTAECDTNQRRHDQLEHYRNCHYRSQCWSFRPNAHLRHVVAIKRELQHQSYIQSQSVRHAQGSAELY
jgi:hypothetical protein